MRTHSKHERCCALLMLPLVALRHCVLQPVAARARAAPAPLVTVQAEHPERGAISEQITADAMLAPLAQAAISPKVTAPVQEVLCATRFSRQGRSAAGDAGEQRPEAAALDNKGAYTAAQGTYDNCHAAHGT